MDIATRSTGHRCCIPAALKDTVGRERRSCNNVQYGNGVVHRVIGRLGIDSLALSQRATVQCSKIHLHCAVRRKEITAVFRRPCVYIVLIIAVVVGELDRDRVARGDVGCERADAQCEHHDKCQQQSSQFFEVFHLDTLLRFIFCPIVCQLGRDYPSCPHFWIGT